MNCVLTTATDADLREYDVRSFTSQTDDEYATAPVAALAPRHLPVDEEVLHTSFEQSLNDRMLTIRWGLQHLSDTAISIEYDTDPISQAYADTSLPSSQSMISPATHLLLTGKKWQRAIIFSGLALSFMLLGFDLMGILILFMR